MRPIRLAIAMCMCVAALAACGSGDPYVWRVTPAGGSNTFPSGAAVTFPEGAIEEAADVRADTVGAGALPAPQPGKPAPVGDGFTLDLGGATLVAPVEVAIAQPEGGDGGVVYLAAHDDTHSAWVATGATEDAGDGILRGAAFRAGTFAVLRWAGEDVDRAMQPILEGIFAGGPSGVAAPECGAAPRDVRVDPGQDAALLTCVDKGDGGYVVKGRNTRSYAVSVALPEGATVEPVGPGTLPAAVWQTVAASVPPGLAVVPPGAEVVIHLGEVGQGASLQLATSVDGLAYFTSVLDAAVKVDRQAAVALGETESLDAVLAASDLGGCSAAAQVIPGAPADAAAAQRIARDAPRCVNESLRRGGGDHLVTLRAAQPAVQAHVDSYVGTGEKVVSTFQAQSSKTVTATRERDTLSSGDKLRFDGIGPVKVGMTVSQARDAAGVAITSPVDELDNGCGYSEVPSMRGLSFMFIDGTIARVDVDAGAATEAGIRVGDDVAKVRKAYGSKIKEEPHEYVQGGQYLSVRSGSNSLLFETDGSKVTTMRSGESDAVALVEGCA